MDRTFVTTPDANGNLDLLTDEDGSPTDYVYDETNRLKQVNVDGVPTVTYTLDAAGRPTLATYVNGTSMTAGCPADGCSRRQGLRHDFAPMTLAASN